MNFAWVVLENMLGTHKILAKPKYRDTPQTQKEGLPYVCHLTRIFKHFDINTRGYAKECVKPM